MRVDIKIKWDAISRDSEVTLEDLIEIMHAGVHKNNIHEAISDWYDATYDELPEDNTQSAMDFAGKDN